MMSSVNTTASPPGSPTTAPTLRKGHRGGAALLLPSAPPCAERAAAQTTSHHDGDMLPEEGQRSDYEASPSAVLVDETDAGSAVHTEGSAAAVEAGLDCRPAQDEGVDELEDDRTHTDDDASGCALEDEYEDSCPLPAPDAGADTSIEVDQSLRDNRHNPDSCSDTLFVSGLHRDVRSADLEDKFSKLGDVEECRIVINPVSKESRGFAFLRYKDAAIAEKAVQELNKILIMGKVMTVERAKRSEPHRKTPGQYKGPVGASVKYDKEGRLRPGFVPFWDLPPPKDGTAISDTSDIKVEQQPLSHRSRRRSSDYSPRRLHPYAPAGHPRRRRSAERPCVSTGPHHQPHSEGHRNPATTDEHRYSRDRYSHPYHDHDDERVYRQEYSRRYMHDKRYARGASPEGLPRVRPSSYSHCDVYSSRGGRYDDHSGVAAHRCIRSPPPTSHSDAWDVRRRSAVDSEEGHAAYSLRDDDAGGYRSGANRSTRAPYSRGETASRHGSRYTHGAAAYRSGLSSSEGLYDSKYSAHHSRDQGRRQRGEYVYDKQPLTLSDDESSAMPNGAPYSSARGAASNMHNDHNGSSVRRQRSRSPYADHGAYRQDAKVAPRFIDHHRTLDRSPPPSTRRHRTGTGRHTAVHTNYREDRSSSNVLNGGAGVDRSESPPAAWGGRRSGSADGRSDEPRCAGASEEQQYSSGSDAAGWRDGRSGAVRSSRSDLRR